MTNDNDLEKSQQYHDEETYLSLPNEVWLAWIVKNIGDDICSDINNELDVTSLQSYAG